VAFHRSPFPIRPNPDEFFHRRKILGFHHGLGLIFANDRLRDIVWKYCRTGGFSSRQIAFFSRHPNGASLRSGLIIAHQTGDL